MALVGFCLFAVGVTWLTHNYQCHFQYKRNIFGYELSKQMFMCRIFDPTGARKSSCKDLYKSLPEVNCFAFFCPRTEKSAFCLVRNLGHLLLRFFWIPHIPYLYCKTLRKCDCITCLICFYLCNIANKPSIKITVGSLRFFFLVIKINKLCYLQNPNAASFAYCNFGRDLVREREFALHSVLKSMQPFKKLINRYLICVAFLFPDARVAIEMHAVWSRACLIFALFCLFSFLLLFSVHDSV